MVRNDLNRDPKDRLFKLVTGVILGAALALLALAVAIVAHAAEPPPSAAPAATWTVLPPPPPPGPRRDITVLEWTCCGDPEDLTIPLLPDLTVTDPLEHRETLEPLMQDYLQ